MPTDDRLPIPGSERELDPAHARVDDIDDTASISVTVYLRPRSAAPAQARVAREAWAQRHGAHPDDVDAVTAFAREHGLTVEQADPSRRAVMLRGTVKDVSAAFGAQLQGIYEASAAGTRYRARSGPLTVPPQLDAVVTAVLGIDDRPQARPHIRFTQNATSSYTPPQVAEAYAFPTGGAAGETVGIIELGGGYEEADLTAYFAQLGLTAPSVTAVPVDGGSNSPGTDTNADGEVMLDIEVVGAVAQGAAIAVYFAPNTDQGFIDAVSMAVHDTTRTPSVVSISWGGSEDSWTAQARTQMEQILTDAGTLGVTVTVAAGDNGSTDGATDGKQHVDFPASAPHALGCGGTNLQASGTTISSETVWDTTQDGATGGGISDAFPVPSYQTAAKPPDNADTGKPGRGVPDVCGDADPDSGYRIRVDGSEETIGGTSAVAPLWAGLIAVLNHRLGTPLGFVHPKLYALLGTSAFHDITSGSNGAYSAGPGWDACTGLGSPDGVELAAALASAG